METSNSTEGKLNAKYTVLIILAVLLIGLFMFWQPYGKQQGSSTLPPLVPSQSEQQTAVSSGSQTLLGTIQGIQGQIITLAPDSGSSASVTVAVDQATTFRQAIRKDQATLQKELAAFNAELEKSGADSKTLVPPSPFIMKNITLQDLKKGDKIQVTLNKTNSIATSVVVKISALP